VRLTPRGAGEVVRATQETPSWTSEVWFSQTD
jgi:hypothetical protein